MRRQAPTLSPTLRCDGARRSETRTTLRWNPVQRRVEHFNWYRLAWHCWQIGPNRASYVRQLAATPYAASVEYADTWCEPINPELPS